VIAEDNACRTSTSLESLICQCILESIHPPWVHCVEHVTEQEDGGPFVGRAGLELRVRAVALHLGHANIVDTAPVLRSVALERRSDSPSLKHVRTHGGGHMSATNLTSSLRGGCGPTGPYCR
jgi:hypothetical protein